MRILHLATGKSGGARLAASRLVNLQEEHGYEVELLPPINHRKNQGFNSRIIDVSGKITTLAQRVVTVSPYGLVSTFSVSKMARFNIDLQNFDVLHIHNWFNLLNLDDLRDYSKEIPLIFTLHDERLLTGGCHYTFECRNYHNGCTNCPAIKFGKKSISDNHSDLSDIFENIPNYGVISPSNWLMKKAHNSKLLKHAKVAKVIPNVTKLTDVFESKYLKHDERLTNSILFVAADISQKIKGFSLLNNALREVHSSHPGFTLHIVGKASSLPELDFSHVYHGYLNEVELKRIMSQTQICVIPSILDNLPSVAIEAITEGNILIVNDVGGLAELVQEGITGFKSVPDVENLSKVILRVLQMSGETLDQIRLASLRSIQEKYADESVFEQHNRVYKEICEQPK